MNPWWLSTLSGIPITWWAINRCRAMCDSSWRGYKKRRDKEARIHDANVQRSFAVRQLSEVSEAVDYCFGCDEVRPRSWMAFVDSDGDGIPDADYRCRVCRGEPDPVESQEACNARIERVYNPNGHDTECQCSNCEPAQNGWNIGHGLVINVDQMQHEQMVGRWQEQDFEALRGDDPVDLGKLNYTDAVDLYRSRGIDATNETDSIYRRRLAERRQRRQAELRRKYRMDTGEWRDHVVR